MFLKKSVSGLIGLLAIAASSIAYAAAEVPVAPTATLVPDGEAVYNRVCVACHATGVSGAPIMGNKEAWASEIKEGIDQLVIDSIKGEGAMPPKGGCMTCSDAEIKAAVEYMVQKSS